MIRKFTFSISGSRIGRIEKVHFRSTIRRDMSGYLPCRQSDRLCSFCVCFYALSGGVKTHRSRAGENQLKLPRVLLADFMGSVCTQLLAVLKRAFSSRLFREQSVRLALGERSSALSSRLWHWKSLRVAKASTAAAAVLRKGHRYHVVTIVS